MTQLGETVAFGMIGDDEIECTFSHDKKGKVSNKLSKNATTLGSRMESGTSTRLWKQDGDDYSEATNKEAALEQIKVKECDDRNGVDVRLDGGETINLPFSVAAHHLIPTKASFTKSSVMKYVSASASGSKIESDIGYDVNGSENGLWLPTHHGLSSEMGSKGSRKLPGESKKVSYGSVSKEGGGQVASFVTLYTSAVMEQTKRQFHDGHPNYSSFVTGCLNKVAAAIAKASENCQKCNESDGDKSPAPYMLVRRLNGVSQRLVTYLVGDPSGWRPPLFTSPHAELYCVNEIAFRKAMAGRS
ncbi:AHH domain-containing protein [Novipirellula artificiosorum]|uniref:A nuclease family of the HNH/ENDO VII superfamily with conserved AHH n=1 Tax=Novipirellula artificiosorum TaxID=2528016 RepID=A0A5C6DZV9_9BACT|nr:AHH domain-containing protein [Novipirellula artificiosorum]TWU40596.1 hypothetical protein Poly41_14290 [Novipirellula artificiosorum]